MCAGSPSRPSVSVEEEQTTSQEKPVPALPATPSTSCQDPSPEKKAEDQTQSLDPQNASEEKVPSSGKLPLPEPFSPRRRNSNSSVSSEGASPSNLPLKVAGDAEDRKKLVKAYRLKEMMKLERSKERKQRRGKHPVYEYSGPLDRSKMTMRDLLYYLPETNPMSTPVMEEQLQTEKANPPSPNKELQEKKQDDEDEEFEEDDNAMDEQLLVPKVKVAEDGSLVIDEESLTVEVLRAKASAVVEENDPIFERGSTTTYSSFKKLCHTKVWSNKETDMFFLAISMVGTDFSLICQLLPHRTRAEIKNKFKREERANAWRIDKAFREKRPFDLKFFSTLLELVLAADKKKRNKPKKKASGGAKPRRKRKAKKASTKGANGDQVTSDVDLDSDAAAGDSETAEKENEDCSNVVESADEPVTTKRKRKRRKKDQEDKEEEEEEEEQPSVKRQAKGRRRKRSKKTQNDKAVVIDSEEEVADGRPDAEEAVLSQTVDSVEDGMGEPEGKPAWKSRRRTQKPTPKLGRAKRKKKTCESDERPGEMEEEEGVADCDSVPKASDEAA
ncbi:transcription factor TFIIIB component B'' homolog, partial [Megalops cyprinoides]|uniref:transcription factor TFIIIB component B'' homolog n=1 Tax=Megalops cyprinoides TaxID=118141 RepID=UPI001863B49D